MGKIKSNSYVPLSKQIKEKLLEDIRKGRILPGEKIPSEEKLAEEFGISRMTVREAIIELINENLLFRMPGKGTFLTQEFNNGQNTIKDLIVIKVPNLRNSFYFQIISGIQKVLSREGIEFTIFSERDNPIEEKIYLRKILKEKRKGLFLISSYYTHTNRSTVDKISKEIPIVIIDVEIPGISADMVMSDDYKGGFLITEHLIELGNKKILHLSGPVGDSSADERRNGYINAIEKYKIKEKIIRFTKWSLEDGYFETKKYFLNYNADAIFACNDEVAVGAYKALRELNLRVPEDISLVGYGNMEVGQILESPLTTVDQQAEKIGESAAELLINKIKGKRKFSDIKKVKIDTKLIIRKSCGIYEKGIKYGDKNT